jgi:dihydropteroate synthase
MQDLTIGGLTFAWGSRTYVMGILNITPDSFSGDGLMGKGGTWVEEAVAQAQQFFADGADLVDIGGESTRPGSEEVSAAEEMQRIIPVIERLAAAGLGPISVDTVKAEVARVALAAGAHIINDISGLQANPALGSAVAAGGAPIILMHNRSKREAVARYERVGSSYLAADYTEVVSDVCHELTASVALAKAAGIPDQHIILDPGIGFGKTLDQNLELIDRLAELRELGFPVLVGSSRKSFIGRVLDVPPDERIEGTAATVAIAIARGADIVRVHDVKVMARVAHMADALVRRQARETQ